MFAEFIPIVGDISSSQEKWVKRERESIVLSRSLKGSFRCNALLTIKHWTLDYTQGRISLPSQDLK